MAGERGSGGAAGLQERRGFRSGFRGDPMAVVAPEWTDRGGVNEIVKIFFRKSLALY